MVRAEYQRPDQLTGLPDPNQRQKRIDTLLGAIGRTAERPLQARTSKAMAVFCEEIMRAVSVEDAAKTAGVRSGTVQTWREKYPPFAEFVARQIGENKALRAEVRRARAAAQNIVVSRETPRPDRGGLAEFRLKYFGRPTPEHQQLVVEALEDYTNLYIFVLGPPGMGKDTLAGDYCGWEAAPDTSGKTVAWFMESGDFSERRFARLEQYLIDSHAYDRAPSKTPGGRKPEASLITDYGPFKWDAKMVWDDTGEKVQKKRWTAHAKYFVLVDAPEQDPNLWATGIGGATYGSRIKVCVCSDIFTLENQRSPTERATTYEWVSETLDTRLDDDGRLVVLGTMLSIENNYERMIAEYTEGARVVYTRNKGTGTLTKYSNGVATVIIQAIGTDDDGGEVSFWPDMFPLDDQIRWKGKTYLVDELTDERLQHLVTAHERSPKDKARQVRGLRGRRQRGPAAFAAMYQQIRDRSVGGDFTDAMLDKTKDYDRSFGQVYAHELRVIGVDPARRYGAGWVLLAVDRDKKIITYADDYFGSDLGYTGIKQRLVIEPITKWNPMWYCYETNAEGAILDDSLIRAVLDESGVSVFGKPTGKDRGDPNIGPGSLAQWMLTGQFRIPYATHEDRARFTRVADHFKAWDSRTNTQRTKPGQPGHQPDELCMACWMASLKAVPLLLTDRKSFGVRMSLPPSVERRLNRFAQTRAADKAAKRVRAGTVRAPHVAVADIIEEMVRND